MNESYIYIYVCIYISIYMYVCVDSSDASVWMWISFAHINKWCMYIYIIIFLVVSSDASVWMWNATSGACMAVLSECIECVLHA